MIDRAKRWAGAHWLRASGRADRNRRDLYGGATGLRVVTFHETLPREMDLLQRIVEWCAERYPMARPEDADDLFAGRWIPGATDKVLVTFDDGLSSNYEAARWLADQGVAATFYVVPSLLDRSMDEFVRYHRDRGVKAHPPRSAPGARGLSATQVREMAAMGHRIGAHNFAHRDLGELHDEASLQYEIGNALEGVGELTGQPCADFAIGFGQPENLSDEAARYLLERPLRVFACHRGLNVPGRTPRFGLRHAFAEEHPLAFTLACMQGSADHLLASRDLEMRRRVGLLPGPPT